MSTRDHEAADFGRDVGVELGKTAEDFSAMLYRFVRRARWFDGAALLLLLMLACAGVWWPGAVGYFTVSLTVDLLLCRKLNPKRSRGES